MSFTMKALTAVLCTIATTTNAYMHRLPDEWTKEHETMIQSNDFNFISLYDKNDENAVEIDKLIEKASKWFEGKINGTEKDHISG